MYPFKKVLVALDLTDLDEVVIRYASMISKLLKTEQVMFVNIIKNVTIPEAVLKEFPKLLEGSVEERENKIKTKLKSYFDNEAAEQKIVVEQGKIARTILSLADEQDVDLVILGRRAQEKDFGLLAQRLARQANCSILIVPEKCKAKLEKIQVLSDFSDYAQYSMEKAIELASNAPKEIEIHCQNVYVVPVGYHYTGKSYEEFAEVMRDNAEKEFAKFKDKLDAKGQEIKPIYNLSKDEDRVETFYKLAKRLKPDLILFGARGLTKTSNFLLGSNAEKMVQIDTQFPLALIRLKNDRAGLMSYFRSL
ncbi:MAG: universal stress protein [Cytophagales bacterium]|nr:universal stress protein [Cytophagales bacterium]